jgi:hypothetical protein
MEREKEFVSLRWVVAGILLGIIGGLLLNRAGGAESPLFGVVGLGADLFIRLLRMVIVPLVVASLISAAAGLDTRYLGRLGVITLIYYTTTTIMAAALGLVIVNLVDPGVGAVLQGAQTPKEILEREPPTFADLLRNLIPANPIDALARADMLQIISFSLIVGVALNLMGDRAQALKGFVSELLDLSMVIVRWVLYLLPVGVALLLARAIGQAGWEVFAPLAKYMGAVLGGLAVHGLIVLPLLVWLLGGVPPWRFLNGHLERDDYRAQHQLQRGDAARDDAHRRTRTQGAWLHQSVLHSHRRDGEHGRHRAVRGGRRAVYRAGVWRAVRVHAADSGAVHGDAGGDWRGGHPQRGAVHDGHRAAGGWAAAGGHRADSGSGPHSGHVPHDGQCRRRCRRRGNSGECRRQEVGLHLSTCASHDSGMSRSLSRDWIAQEIAHTFQLPLVSLPVRLATEAIHHLARRQRDKTARPRTLPPHLWQAAREEACHFCLQTLAQLIQLERGPDALPPETAAMYDAFLTAVRQYLETPPPQLPDAAPELSAAERLKQEQHLWRQAREALELCEKWRKAMHAPRADAKP